LQLQQSNRAGTDGIDSSSKIMAFKAKFNLTKNITDFLCKIQYAHNLVPTFSESKMKILSLTIHFDMSVRQFESSMAGHQRLNVPQAQV
jgi:hypothetical protein